MVTEAEIKTKHKEIHDSLTKDYCKNHLMSKEEFDYLHGQNWNDMEAELLAKGYLKPPEPSEIDKIWAEIEKLKEATNGT